MKKVRYENTGNKKKFSNFVCCHLKAEEYEQKNLSYRHSEF